MGALVGMVFGCLLTMVGLNSTLAPWLAGTQTTVPPGQSFVGKASGGAQINIGPKQSEVPRVNRSPLDPEWIDPEFGPVFSLKNSPVFHHAECSHLTNSTTGRTTFKHIQDITAQGKNLSPCSHCRKLMVERADASASPHPGGR